MFHNTAAIGTHFLCALNENGHVVFRGKWHRDKKIKCTKKGKNSTKIITNECFISISATTNSCLFLRGDGIVFCFGNNFDGHLGVHTNGQITIPQEIPNLPQIKKILCSPPNTSFLIDSIGNVWTCGLGDGFSNGFSTRKFTFEIIPNLPPIKCVDSHRCSTLFLDFEGNVWKCCERTRSVVQITDLPCIIDIAAGIYGNFFLDENFEIWSEMNGLENLSKNCDCLKKIESIYCIKDTVIAKDFDNNCWVDKYKFWQALGYPQVSPEDFESECKVRSHVKLDLPEPITRIYVGNLNAQQVLFLSYSGTLYGIGDNSNFCLIPWSTIHSTSKYVNNAVNISFPKVLIPDLIIFGNSAKSARK